MDWQSADRFGTGLVPSPSEHPDATVRVFAARAVRWRGIFAVHGWTVFKEQNAPRYPRYDYTAWGGPIRVNGFAADGRWFGDVPQVIGAADDAAAAQMIPKIRNAIENYKVRSFGDYRAWPGPNSNTFVAAALATVPELKTALPPTAIGMDYPVNGEWFGLTPSATGVRLTLDGYFGLALGWVEGFEIDILGAVLGLDLRRPAIKLPDIGRIGMSFA